MSTDDAVDTTPVADRYADDPLVVDADAGRTGGGADSRPVRRASISRRPAWLDRRFAGKVMIGVAVVGFVTSLAAAAVGWQLVADLSSGTDRSLLLAEESLRTLDGTIDVAEAVVVAVDDGLETIRSTLMAVGGTVDDTAAIADTTAELTVEIPPSLDRMDATLATVEDLGATIDRTLRQASQLPIGPDYDPDVPLDEAIAGLRDDLAPIADGLRESSAELTAFADGSAELRAEIDGLVRDTRRVEDALAGSSELLEQYRATAAGAADLAADTRRELDTDLTRSRILIVILGLTFAVGQIVPAWVGRELLIDARHPGRTSRVKDPEEES